MTTLALCSVKASPGVTTTAQALAEVWPAERALLLAELDPAGGDLAARLERSPEPGLVSLAAAGRRGIDANLVLDHAQTTTESTHLLLAPPSARQAKASLDLLGDELADVLCSLDGFDVVMDCGRVNPGASGMPWLAAADQVLVVLRPSAAEVAHVATAMPDLRSEHEHVALVLVGEPGPGQHHLYPADEVAVSVGVGVVAVIAQDERAAGALDGRRRGERLLRRSQLLRSASALASAVTTTTEGTLPSAQVGNAPPASVSRLLIEGAS